MASPSAAASARLISTPRACTCTDAAAPVHPPPPQAKGGAGTPLGGDDLDELGAPGGWREPPRRPAAGARRRALLDVARAAVAQPTPGAAAAREARRGGGGDGGGGGAATTASGGASGAADTAAAAVVSELGARMLALQRRTHSAAKGVERITFLLAPLPSVRTVFLHFDNTTISRMHYDFCGDDRQLVDGATRCTASTQADPIPECAKEAWPAFFKSHFLGRKGKSWQQDPNDVRAGTFAGHISTDDVSIHICTKPAKALGAPRHEAAASSSDADALDTDPGLLEARRQLQRLKVFDLFDGKHALKGYRNAVGGDRAARKAARQLRTAGAVDLARVLRCIPTGRTADVDAFSLHCRRKLAAFAAGRRLYGSLPRRNARLRKQLARTRHFHRLAQMLAWGASSVRGRWNRAPRPVADKPELASIGWGAASAGFGGPISRKGLGQSRAFEHFVHSHYHPSVCFVRCNEFHTSQVCTRCWKLRPKRPAAHFEVGGSLCYKLLVCRKHTPQLVVDRDVSASSAIMAVLLEGLFKDKVPDGCTDWRKPRTPTGGGA
ncbi:MAG: hypothetical protein J3K34DRAFT_403808 [Monoraphidium minutum]|nr:MAG: hypothetical protein J3K34DRAFT_403808 [Monoraphidium minutum]